MVSCLLTTLRFFGVKDGRLIVIRGIFSIEIIGVERGKLVVEAEVGGGGRIVVGEEEAGVAPQRKQEVMPKALL
jgi:hypothetical protein